MLAPHDGHVAPRPADRRRCRRPSRTSCARRAGAAGAVRGRRRLLHLPGAHLGRVGDRLVGCRGRMADQDMFYDDDADLSLLDGKTVAIIGYGSQGHAHALNLKDSGVNVVVGLREDSASRRARPAAPASRSSPVAEAASRGDIVMMLVPDEQHRERLGGRDRRRHRRGQPAALRPRLLDPLRRGRAAAGRRRRARRAEGPGPPRPPPVHRGPRRPGPRSRSTRTRPATRQALALAYAQGHRLHARRRHRDDLQGRDRDRPVRRAGRPVRRRLRARAGRLRDARRGRLRPAHGVLRVPARAQADRRPDVREGHRRDALLDLQHGRVRRHHPRQAHHHRRDARRR